MVSTGDDFFSWAGGLINNTAIFQAGSNFVVILLAMLVVAILISPKKPRNWIKLFLPILVWFKILGLQVNFMFLIIAGIMFIIETMSLEVMGSVLQAGSERISGIIQAPELLRKKRISKLEKRWALEDRESRIGRRGIEKEWQKLNIDEELNKIKNMKLTQKERKEMQPYIDQLREQKHLKNLSLAKYSAEGERDPSVRTAIKQGSLINKGASLFDSDINIFKRKERAIEHINDTHKPMSFIAGIREDERRLKAIRERKNANRIGRNQSARISQGLRLRQIRYNFEKNITGKENRWKRKKKNNWEFIGE